MALARMGGSFTCFATRATVVLALVSTMIGVVDFTARLTLAEGARLDAAVVRATTRTALTGGGVLPREWLDCIGF